MLPVIVAAGTGLQVKKMTPKRRDAIRKNIRKKAVGTAAYSKGSGISRKRAAAKLRSIRLRNSGSNIVRLKDLASDLAHEVKLADRIKSIEAELINAWYHKK